ncbi:ABC transporter substrate-binding protein [Pusillimonas sp. TS35]|uniref:tripartite tricarboxylate transporter substrate-binding protein n=1 Tax=Paracandidimonas lactea TaxID=2895524 RepID=UPI00136D4826|nr:tripartite tricarboxylate transporter substrate-binding protein [Paracandidimonas lactea]MYN11570.1 ABC transporter substrate-binding protein [Pusillimonas sp. TS35]
MVQNPIRAAAAACLLSGLLFTGASHAAAPAEPLTVVVPYAPGGASDRAARIVSDGLQKKLGVPVIVENKTGAGGRIAAQYVKGASADKNILILANPAIMVVAPMVFSELSYDAAKDFQPVSMVTQYGFGVAVSADSKIQDMKQLIGWAKEHPGAFNIGVPATGSLPHFFGLMLSQQIGAKGEIIGYRGSAPVITDLIGGAVPLAIDTLDVLTAQHQGKRIRILATSGGERETALPDVPTFKQVGVDLEASGWNAFFAPASMPADKVARLGDAIKAVTADSAVQQTLLQNELIPVSASAKETRARIEQFREQWAPVIKASGFVVTK